MESDIETEIKKRLCSMGLVGIGKPTDKSNLNMDTKSEKKRKRLSRLGKILVGSMLILFILSCIFS